MFCVEFSSQSRLSVATIIFYTCIWIPFIGMKQSIRSIIGGFLSLGSNSYSTTTTDRQTNAIDISSSSSELVVVTDECLEDTCWQLDHHHHELLPVVKFEELEHYYNSSTTRNDPKSSSTSPSSPRISISKDGGGEEEDPEEEEVCSVCLGVFQKEEEVNQLSQCGHVFHHRCISSWVHLNRFTCPLCRSPVFSNNYTSGAAAYAIQASSSSWAT